MKELMKVTNDENETLHLIDREAGYQPYVVCWNFNGTSWDWGTYCTTLKQAKEIFHTKMDGFF